MLNHKHSYIICTTPRSGSTLLCDLLTEAGAGRPDSFFNFEAFDWPDYFNVSAAEWSNKHEFDQSYLSAVLEYGTNDTSVFGMRLMWESFSNLSRRLELFYPGLMNDSARFQAAFGEPVYLHLSRQDKVAQAVSDLRAEQSGLWHVWADGSERERLKPEAEPVYDAQALVKLVSMAQEHDAAWISWFARQGLEPVSLMYEELATDPQAVLATVLSALGLDPEIAKDITPKTAKLADGISLEWITRFRVNYEDYH